MKRTIDSYFAAPSKPPKLPRTTSSPAAQNEDEKTDSGPAQTVLPPAPLTSLAPKVPRIYLTSTSWVDVLKIPESMSLTFGEFEALWRLRPKERGKVRIMGRVVTTPRWSQAFGRPYFYSGVMHEAAPMVPVLQRLLDWCRGRTPTLNGCLVNWYETGGDYIGPHSDDESELLPLSEVHSLSFGSARELVFVTKGTPMETAATVPLTDRTLVIMGGTCQRTHKHTVPKAAGPLERTGRRINVTFRSFRDRPVKKQH